MKVLNVVGARPNFMKVAPLQKSFSRHAHIQSKVVHTGQHYDQRMSDIFFNQLELPVPDYYLGVGSGSHAEITARIMIEFEKIVLQEQPDLVLVVGDVNSTLACALVTKKLNIKLAHVEAGLRSGDRRMPEELNRILTDSIADYLFVTEESGLVNLNQEGVSEKRISFSGNVMIDSLCNYREKAAQLNLLEELNLKPGEYTLMTMHRPANVDTLEKLAIVVEAIEKLASLKKVVLPLHPRTAKSLKKFSLWEQVSKISNLMLLEPQGYLEFLQLMDNAAIIVTDSGGIQEESTYLQIPCLTIRESTERPVTITMGTNTLVPDLDADLIVKHFKASLEREKKSSTIPPLWDGQAAERIVNYLIEQFSGSNRTKPLSNSAANA